jgi:hypothetical protein
MMKVLTSALGGLTVLAVSGLATPPGQAMLGIRQTQAAAPVSVISDPGPVQLAVPTAGPVEPTPVRVEPAAPAGSAPAPRAVAAPVARPTADSRASQPVARPVARPAAPVQAAPTQAAPALAGAGAITNLLLNLPQVLHEGPPVAPEGGPAYGPPPGPPGPPPGRRAGWRHDRERQNDGEYGH